MSIQACVSLVQQGDADRFLSAMTAPPALRARLLVLYAFNLEIARAPWVTKEPMIAEMRLQWWADVIDEIEAGKPARAHEVAAPLADLVTACALPTALLRDMVEARRFDAYKEPHADDNAFSAYIDRTSGNLMWLAALSLGADKAAETVVRDFAFGAGVAALFRAVPALEAAGRFPLIDGRPEAVAALARKARARIAVARRKRGLVSRDARAALFAGWQAGAVLRRATKTPELVAGDGLESAEFQRRVSLLGRSVTGRW